MFASLFMLGFSACPRPTISGTVADQEGTPAAAVKVDVAGTTLSTLTDDKGAYAVQYVPGSVRVTVTKDGYLPVARSYDIAESTTFPAAPITLFPYTPGSTFSSLVSGKAEGVPGVALSRNADAGFSGLPLLPATKLPGDLWGFVYVPQGEVADGDDVSALLAGLAARGGPDPGVELYRLTWKDSEVISGWYRRTKVAVHMWVGDTRVDSTVKPSDPLTPAGWILRPNASLDDGVYGLSVRGSKIMWPFTVGAVEQPTNDQERYDE